MISLDAFLQMETVNERIHNLINFIVVYFMIDDFDDNEIVHSQKIAYIQSLTNIPNHYNDSWHHCPMIHITDEFLKIEDDVEKFNALSKLKFSLMFAIFEKDMSLCSLKIPKLEDPYGIAAYQLMYKFLQCFEDNCNGFANFACVLCQTALCANHFFNEESVAKCSTCDHWYRMTKQGQTWNANHVILWENKKTREIRFSYVLPKTSDDVFMDFSSGNTMSRETFERLKYKDLSFQTKFSPRDLRKRTFFERVLVFCLVFFACGDNAMDLRIDWSQHVNCSSLESICKVYNLICGEEHPPLNMIEFTDIVVDLLYVFRLPATRNCMIDVLDLINLKRSQKQL